MDAKLSAGAWAECDAVCVCDAAAAAAWGGGHDGREVEPFRLGLKVMTEIEDLADALENTRVIPIAPHAVDLCRLHHQSRHAAKPIAVAQVGNITGCVPARSILSYLRLILTEFI